MTWQGRAGVMKALRGCRTEGAQHTWQHICLSPHAHGCNLARKLLAKSTIETS